MLNITFANRLETLEAALLDAIEQPPASPFAADQIIVPSAAVRRRLTLAIAGRQGVCANVDFAFLGQWLWQQIARVVPAVASDSPFASPVLAWRVFRLFGDAAFLAAHPRLGGYLAQADAVMRLELATKSAGLLEQYLTYRQDWLAAWSDGRLVTTPRHEDEAWQAALWQRIAQELGTGRQHPAATFLGAVEAQQGAPAAGLPAAAHVFCLPTMPPLYIDILRRLGRWMDLRLYVQNPCREYWFEVVDRRRLSYLAISEPAGHHEEGNRLLAAWGKQTQAHIDLLLEHAGDAVVDDDRFVAADSRTLLGRLQNAILDLDELAPASIALDDGDRSLEVHVCHSLTRELEVLHDRLLGLFAGQGQTPPPQPADILVVTPDLDAAAPLIDAVFGNAPQERRIPYSISGRGRTGINAAARALLELLALAGSRFTASAVFELLQQPIVHRRMGLDAAALDSLRGWIEAAAIRWGIDGRHREALGLPGIERHSFDDGLQRLFLGYALPDATPAGATPFDGRLPAGGAEGSESLLLGVLDDFIDRLARLPRELGRPKTPDDWLAALQALCDGFLAPAGDEIDELRELQQAIRELHANMTRGGVDEPVAREVVEAALAALLDDPAHGGVPTGAVTFSSMSSLRHLPYRVVCVVGLNDRAFPTDARPAEFDLMAAQPRRGDRQRRHDERNLFLDLLLAARDCLHLSCTGRSVYDNSPLPPSVLIAELLDLAVAATAAEPTPAAQAAARRRLVVEQPLQAFSPACFDIAAEPRRRSFRREYCAALQAGLAAPAAPPTAVSALPVANAGDGDDGDASDDAAPEAHRLFFAAPLLPPDAEWREVGLDQLTEFFRNPSRYLLRRRLGLDLFAADDELQDDEPFLPEFGGRGAVAARLLPALLAGTPPTELRAAGLAGCEYPAGRLGELLFERELQNLAAFAGRLRADTAAPCLAPHGISLDFELDGERWRFHAGFADLRPAGLVRQRYDDTRPGDYLAGWLAHLALCAAPPAGMPAETRWHSRDGSYRLAPCADARAQLAKLLRLYREGLSAPLHFYPKAAWQFVKNGGNRHKALDAWRASERNPYGEEADAAYRLALRGCADPLDAAFAACAETVFGAMLACLEDQRL